MTEPERMAMNEIARPDPEYDARLDLVIQNLKVALTIARGHVDEAMAAIESRPAIVDGMTRRNRWDGLRRLVGMMKRGTP